MASSARESDENGYLTIKGNPISSFGIFPYSAQQLGIAEGDPKRIINVFRPESTVNDPEAINSFQNVPLINEHTYLNGAADGPGSAPEKKGVEGVLSNVRYEKPWMRGDLKVFSRDMQQQLSSGKKDLSLGYKCQFEHNPGEFDGQPYEFVQTKMRGNHIALVGEGRVPGAHVLDGLTFDAKEGVLCYDHLDFEVVKPSNNGDSNMVNKAKTRKVGDNSPEALRAKLAELMPILNEFLGEEAKEPEHQDGEEGGMAGMAKGDEGGQDLGALIQAVEGALAELKAAHAGAEAEEGGENPSVDGKHAKDEESEQGPPAGEPHENQAGDEVEGLNNGKKKPIADSDGEGAKEVVKASEGPKSGKNAMAQDSAIATFYGDLADKNSLYDRASQIVGAFDHARMDCAGVASYVLKKIGITAPKGQERIALDSFLRGHEAKKASAVQQAKARITADSKELSAIEKYRAELLKGKGE